MTRYVDEEKRATINFLEDLHSTDSQIHLIGMYIIHRTTIDKDIVF
jgi:hypothetical protein